LPSILKRFIRPEASPYQFPPAEELVTETTPEVPPKNSNELSSTKTPPPPISSQTPIDYAKLQAEAILENAKQQAQDILERAKVDATTKLEELRAEAQAEGFQTGYSEGVAHALTEAQAQRAAQAVELGSHIKNFLELANQAHNKLLEQSQDELRDLAISIAEKIVRVSLKSSGEVIARMIQGSTEKMKRKEWVHIYVADCDTKTLAQASPHLVSSLAYLSDHVKILPISDDESGTCIIEMPDEIIDASVSTQLSNIKELLMEPKEKSSS
jgi:flagellar assembly protein FliH